MRRILAWFAVVLSPLAPTQPILAQVAPAPVAVRVFLDCEFECDSAFLRTEINYLNWVFDRADSDVHVLVSSQETGGGGRALTLKFIGLKAFQGVDDELTHTFTSTETSDERRRGLSQVLKAGLVRYLARTPDGKRLTIGMTPAAGAVVGQGLKPKDPWNAWVFTLSAFTFLQGESQQKFSNLNGEIGASRTTEKWKFNIDLSGSRSQSSFTLPDSTVFKDKTTFYSGSAFAALSLGEHWSAGGIVEGSQSTRANFDLKLRVGPLIEYNVFPYSKSTQKRLTVGYEVAAVQSNYTEVTLFDKTKELLVQQSVAVGGRARQPWGDMSGSVSYSNYLSDFSKNQLDFFAQLNLRVAKGLDLNLFGNYSRIRDQLNLPAGGASRDEILRQLRELETGYRYFINAGLTYRFGSIYNNVVNPRFQSRRSGGRSFRFF